ncbi:MAG TPA: thiamine pyrophosphate-dependent enzyme, partial [Longimicrobiales bacterium]|nr:thiamine pyrophosphate-dependent enzyme [Longimicrobiales bacterium]
GMTSTGAFHEGLNLAAVKRLPLIVVVENNMYAYSTPTSRQTAAASFVAKAAGYGIGGERVDGNDVVAVYEATKRAAARARDGDGPTLLELMTYRRKGHAEHDGQQYVPDGELEEWEARDPVVRYERWLLESDTATEAELEQVRERVAGEVDRAREAAESSPMPEPMAAIDDVYGGEPGWTPWTRRAPHDPHQA